MAVFFDVQNPTSMIIALCYYQHNISNNNPTTIITTSMVIANPIPPNLKHSPKWSPESGKKNGGWHDSLLLHLLFSF